jgi:hypothetical protein
MPSYLLPLPSLTVRKTYYLVTQHRRARRRSNLVSPSKDTRFPQVCKSQGDSVGRAQSPFGYAARSINDRTAAGAVGGVPLPVVLRSRVLERPARTRAIQRTI